MRVPRLRVTSLPSFEMWVASNSLSPVSLRQMRASAVMREKRRAMRQENFVMRTIYVT